MKAYTKSISISIVAFLTILFAVNLLSINSSASTLIDNEGIKYIEQENGDMELYTGWTKKSNKRFYYKNGIKQKNKWLLQNGIRTYYLTDDGSAAVGKVTISGTEYEFDSKGKLVQDKWNIKTETEDISDTGLTLVINISDNSFEGEFAYGAPYTIEKLYGNKWRTLTVKNEIDWLDYEEFYNIGLNKHIIQWKNLYGELSEGRYRICKEIYKNTDNKSEAKVYYAYFTIN